MAYRTSTRRAGSASRKILLGLTLLSIFTGLGACNQIFGIHGGEPGPCGGAGGSCSGVTSGGGFGNSSSSTSATNSRSATSATSSTATGTGGGAGGAGGSSPALLQDCVLLMRMDENSWSGVGAVTDSSGFGNNGTAMGTALPTSNGKFGGAALLNGSGYVQVPSSASLQPTTALSYAAWIFTTGLVGDSGGIISKRHGAGDNVAFTMFWYPNPSAPSQINLDADIQNTRFASVTLLSMSTWYHVAVVYDGTLPAGTRARIYINGGHDATSDADTSLGPNSEDLRVGDLPNGGGSFVGRIDEVLIWKRALSASEILAVYNGGAL